MSRVVWGSDTSQQLQKQQGGMRQTTLNFAPAAPGRKRERLEVPGAATAGGAPDAPEPVEFGNRGRQRPTFMDGKARDAAFEASPYSRTFVGASAGVRRDAGGDALTGMDGGIIAAAFLKPGCPPDLFAGRVFFLNSCDADPQVTIFQLEKIIRALGGSTSMGLSGRVSYVVAQHLSSAKETKVRAAVKRTGQPAHTYVHPHYVLACAREGRVVPVGAYRTRIGDAVQPAALVVTKKGGAAPEREVIEID
jgi:hypothetical protein